MKRGIFVSVVGVFMLCFGLAVAETPDKVYFDEQFNRLQQNTAEIKGDTEEIKSVLGTVFEGTVPKGGTLTSICNQNGWNMVVLIGHNNISDPNNVAVGTALSYPKNGEEFQAALKRGKPLYDAWLKKQKIAFKVNQIKTDTVDIDKLNIRTAEVSEMLRIKDMTIDKLKVREAEVSEILRIKNAEIEQLRIKNASIEHLKVRLAEIDDLRIKELTIKNALIEKLRIADLTIGKQQKEIEALNSRPPKTVYKDINGAGYAPPSSMRLSESGDACDEREFSGMVTDAALAASGGQPVDILELHRRTSKSPEFKVKRLHVDASGVAHPAVWTDGRCMRKYSDRPLTEADMRTLLSTGESLRPTDVSDIGSSSYGMHLTEGVYIIHTK